MLMYICYQGPVRFYNNERKANILLKQFQSEKEVKIGEYNSLHGRLDLALGKAIKWVSYGRSLSGRKAYNR